MSHNQPRFEKSEAQFRKPGRSGGGAGHPRGFPSGGGKGGGGGGNAPPASPSLNSSSVGPTQSNPPLPSANRSYRKSGNGQGGQSRVNLTRRNSEAGPADSASSDHSLPNGAHFQPTSRVASDTSIPSSLKQSDVSTPRSSAPIPRPPPSHSHAGVSISSTPKTPAKGDALGSFPLQFGSIYPEFVNGMQIPARTSSAPPNLDEQKHDQARHDAFRAVPTVPSSSLPKQPVLQQPLPPPPPQQHRKDVVNRSQPKTVSDNPPQQIKRDSHLQNPVMSVPGLQKSSNISISGMSMPMFPPTQVPVQFGGHAVQMQPQNVIASPFPMPMVPLSVGNTQQIQQQLFVPSQQSHVMQPQGIMHQGQSLNFAPQISHQLPPQVSSMGMGISTQYPQQQVANFGIQRKTTVKITHPDTHEELRLDKRMDPYIDPSGQRSNINLPSQSQLVPSFASPQQINYYQTLQPGSYAPSTYHHTSSLPTSAQMTSTSQAPKFNYSSGQSSQTVSITKPSAVITLISNKAGPSRHGISESESIGHVHERHPIPNSTVISAALSVNAKSSISIATDKEVISSMTANVLRTLGEESSVVKPLAEATCLPEKKSQRLDDSSAIPLITKHEDREPRDTNAVCTADKPSTADFSVVSVQKIQAYNSFCPAAANSGSVAYTSNNKKRDFTTKSESLKECQQKASEKELCHSQLLDQADVKQSNTCSSTLSLNESKEVSSADMPCRNVLGDYNNTKSDPMATEVPTSSLLTSSSDMRSCSSPEAGESKHVRYENIHASDPFVVLKVNEASEATYIGFSGASPLTTDGIVGRKPATTEIISSSLSTNAIKIECLEATSTEKDGSDLLEVEPRQESPFLRGRNLGEFDYTSPNSYDAKTHHASSTDSMDITDQKMTSKEEVTLFNLKDNKIVRESGMIAPTSAGTTCVNDASSTNISVDKDNSASNIERIHSQEVPISGPSIELMVKELTLTLNTFNTNQMHDSADVASSISISTSPSVSSSCCKDKPLVGVTQTKSNAGKKKKMKEILSKADAVGTNTDLYMAYKGPQETNESANNPESTDSSAISVEEMTAEDAENGVAAHEDGQSRVEVDDWEDAADISTPKLRTADNLERVNGAKQLDDESTVEAFTIKYSRDFLLTFSDQYTDLPSGFEIGSDIADTLMYVQVGVGHAVDRRQFPSSARISDRPSAVNRVDRRAVGGLDDDKWTKTTNSFSSNRDFPMDTSNAATAGLRSGQGISHGVLRNPRGMPSHHTGGILSGPTQSSSAHGGTQRGNSDDRWSRATTFQRGIISSPQTPSQTIHKAEKRYEIGKVSDEEQLKQRQLKGILNKLTPQNFVRLFEQVKEVNIDNIITLKGVISQIFDKALTEPTFCEMYADFCLNLSAALPDFSEDNEKITFKRLLLNKCQEEFERGQREEAEADKDEEEGEMKKTKEEREDKKLKARRRMLGNIRLIGELFKKKMLTERIMHECIKTLLGQHQNPDEEDIEALCKLMSTIGKMIDHVKAKDHMYTYFDIITKLSNNQKLSSRLRFMLKDMIDLRKNNWQERRKVEGPKKIEEVHRDAVQERQAQTSRLSRGPVSSSSARRAPVDYGPRSSTILPNSNSHQLGALRSFTHQARGIGTQDVRHDDRHHSEGRLLSVPLPQRPLNDDSITLGPQGGLARGMSMRTQPLMPTPSADVTTSTGEPRRVILGPNGNSCITERQLPRQTVDRSLSTPDQSQSHDRNPYFGPKDMRSDRTFDRISSNVAAGQSQNANSEANLLSEETLQEKLISAIREYYSAKDVKEIALCIKELNAPHFYPAMVSLWVTDSFERKDAERDHLSELLIKLCLSPDSLLSRVQLIHGFESVLSTLEDAVNDAPKATEFFGRLLAKVVLENVLTLVEIGKLIHEGGEEPGRLLEIGLAADILGSILKVIKLEKGDAYLNELRLSSNMHLEDFLPPQPLKSRKLEAFL